MFLPLASALHPCFPHASPACRLRYSKAKSEQESELQRKGRRWLLCAAAAIAAYVYLSGQYQFNLLSGYELVDEDEEDE